MTYTVDVDKIDDRPGAGLDARCSRAWPGVSERQVFRRQLRRRRRRRSRSRNGTHLLARSRRVNSVFASVSLPVSVNTEGTYLNQVYIGMFRPDSDAFPRWAGNLKQYKLGIGERPARDAGRRFRQARSTTRTGFITECARSFWTPTTTDTYWAFRTARATSPCRGGGFRRLELPGRQHRREGRAGLHVRAPTTARTAQSDLLETTSCASTLPISTARTSRRPSWVPPTHAEHGQLINWALVAWTSTTSRTSTALMTENASLGPRRRRAFAPGGGQHERTAHRPTSRPRSSCSTAATTACCAPSTATGPPAIGSVAAGEEMWAFMPPEFYRNQAAARQHDVESITSATHFARRSPSRTESTGRSLRTGHRTPRPATLWLFASLRRGGRSIYAFDVSTIDTDATSPTLKWRDGCPNLATTRAARRLRGNRPDLERAKVIKTQRLLTSGAGGPPIAASHVILGGGYDTCEDDDPNTCTRPRQGQPDLRARRRHRRNG